MNRTSKLSAPIGLRCLLCGGVPSSAVWTLTGTEVRNLWRTAGRQLSEAAFQGLSADREVTQYACGECGFRFFDPGLAGMAKFYEELELGDYYVKNRPEFDFALKLCRCEHITSVLDVGGGQGAFLDRAREAGLTTFALELNAHAAEAAARKGHRTLNRRIEEVTPAELDGGVQMLTLFQVVEHVPDPVTFLQHAARLVKSGGLLLVAVPNNAGMHVLNPFDPANMPPHHVSRWRECDLERLGASCGLTTVARGADSLHGRPMLEFWLAHNRLSAAIGRRPHVGGTWLPQTVSWLYRKLGCRHYFPRRGLSIYFAYRKP
jgi:SAM-dependent methyltransferase